MDGGEKRLHPRLDVCDAGIRNGLLVGKVLNLSLTGLFEDPESDGKSVYLLNINRARIDVLREVPGFLAGDLHKGARNLLHHKMETVKRNMEKRSQGGAGNS